MVIYKTSPIDEAFRVWIANYPESFHPLDMERFYVFVKCICRYSRKMKGYEWLKNKIEETKKGLPEEVVDVCCQKFVELQKFYHTPRM